MSDRTPSPAKAVQANASPVYVPTIDGDVVAIEVGNKTLHAHEGVLRQSLFFANVLKPEWVSAREGKPIDLKNEDLHIFTAYLQYLYTHHIDTSSDLETLADMYVLGEVLMDLEFQDVILEILMYECEKRKHYVDMVLIEIIYNGTADGSPARELLVDLYYWGGPETWAKIKNDALREVPEFYNDAVDALMSDNRPSHSQKTWVTDKAAYFVGARKKTERLERSTQMDTPWWRAYMKTSMKG
jgi:hypothetical protein